MIKLTTTAANGNGTSKTSTYSDMEPETFQSAITRWMNSNHERGGSTNVLDSDTAVSVLTELSVGGTLMRGAEQSDTIRNYYLSNFLRNLFKCC